MNFIYFESVLIMLLLVSVVGYIFVVLKEKLYLKKNIIVIDKKSITQEHLDDTDLKEFILGGIEVRTGDEVRVILSNSVKMEGIVLGAKKKENLIILVTHQDEIKKFRVNMIKKLSIISKYGRFFKGF